jgi:hypothetical protein
MLDGHRPPRPGAGAPASSRIRSAKIHTPHRERMERIQRIVRILRSPSSPKPYAISRGKPPSANESAAFGPPAFRQGESPQRPDLTHSPRVPGWQRPASPHRSGGLVCRGRARRARIPRGISKTMVAASPIASPELGCPLISGRCHRRRPPPPDSVLLGGAAIQHQLEDEHCGFKPTPRSCPAHPTGARFLPRVPAVPWLAGYACPKPIGTWAFICRFPRVVRRFGPRSAATGPPRSVFASWQKPGSRRRCYLSLPVGQPHRHAEEKARWPSRPPPLAGVQVRAMA